MPERIFPEVSLKAQVALVEHGGQFFQYWATVLSAGSALVFGFFTRGTGAREKIRANPRARTRWNITRAVEEITQLQFWSELWGQFRSPTLSMLDFWVKLGLWVIQEPTDWILGKGGDLRREFQFIRQIQPYVLHISECSDGCWPFHPQKEWLISNFPCSLTRNITSHSMKNLAFSP